jgi:hypothetical protein
MKYSISIGNSGIAGDFSFQSLVQVWRWFKSSYNRHFKIRIKLYF